MKLIAIQKDILINPESIVAIERIESFGNVRLRVYLIDGRSYEITVPTTDFIKEVSECGVDLGKQFFSV